MFKLTNKKALITGGSRGIGANIAKFFADSGAEVIITGTNEAKLKEVSTSIGSNCSYVVANLSNEAEIEHLISNYCTDLDILVNNAGVTKDNLLLRMKSEDWQQVIDVNLTASFKLIKGTIRGMIKKRSGRIINLSSVVGSSGNPGQANYCASKAGLVGLTKSIALEIAARGVTVNCISPGFIQTDMTSALKEDHQKIWLDQIPMAKMGNSEDISYAVSFLASDYSSYITGETIHVNGGMYMSWLIQIINLRNLSLTI